MGLFARKALDRKAAQDAAAGKPPGRQMKQCPRCKGSGKGCEHGQKTRGRHHTNQYRLANPNLPDRDDNRQYKAVMCNGDCTQCNGAGKVPK